MPTFSLPAINSRFLGGDKLEPLFEVRPGEKILRVEQTLPPAAGETSASGGAARPVRQGKITGKNKVFIVRSPEDWQRVEGLKPLKPKQAFEFTATQVVHKAALTREEQEEMDEQEEKEDKQEQDWGQTMKKKKKKKKKKKPQKRTVFEVTCFRLADGRGWISDWGGGADPYTHVAREVVGLADPDDSESAKFGKATC